MNYEVDVGRIVKKISNGGAKRVLLQLPDGLKPRAVQVASELKEATGAEIIVWAGSNFGGCDVPLYVKSQGNDLIVTVGHAEFLMKTNKH